MRIRRAVSWGMALLTLSVSGALAQGPPAATGRRAEIIAKYDVDGDGQLSAVELEAARPQEGTNRTGPRAEMPGAHKTIELKNDARLQALLEQHDVDANGKLDYDEMEALRKTVKTK